MPDLLRIEVERRGDALHVALAGELDIGSVTTVRRELDRVVRRRNIRRLLIDLRRVRFMDATGIHLLLDLSRASSADGYELVVAKGPPVVHRVLELTGTETQIPLVGSPEQAGFGAG